MSLVAQNIPKSSNISCSPTYPIKAPIFMKLPRKEGGGGEERETSPFFNVLFFLIFFIVRSNVRLFGYCQIFLGPNLVVFFCINLFFSGKENIGKNYNSA